MAGRLLTALAASAASQLLPVDSEHAALHQALRGGARRGGGAAGAHRLRRPLLAARRGHLRRHHAGRGARPPDLEDGRQDHRRLGDADEQGARADRGEPPLRRAAASASRWSSTRSRWSTRWSSSATAPGWRSSPSTTWCSRCSTRSPGPSAGATASRACRRPSSAGSTSTPSTRRSSPPSALARRALLAGDSAPAVLNGANEAAVGAFLAGRAPLPGHRRHGRRGARRARRRSRSASLDEALGWDDWGRRRAAELLGGRGQRRADTVRRPVSAEPAGGKRRPVPAFYGRSAFRRHRAAPVSSPPTQPDSEHP